jgi:nucleotidyltransferase substrate binding protein (TIGR01987 family)
MISNSPVNLNALKKAVVSLKEAANEPMIHDKKIGEFIRDSVIQRFEYTYELSWKSLQRYLKQAYNFQADSLRQLYREAGRIGLIDNVESWFAYQEARNLTSHTYNEITAEETYKVALQFAYDAEKLLHKLEEVLKHVTNT